MSLSFDQIEIELTSKCNAICPGCRRTHLDLKGHSYPKVDLDEQTLYKSLQNLNLSKTLIKLCGVLGDPLVHPSMLDITHWIVKQKGRVQISTNASLRSKDYWRELGNLSHESNSVYVHFAVDGLSDTNSVYRVNTHYHRIEENMKAYSQAGGRGAWVFIEFDHNTHQKETIRDLAKNLGLEFYVRRAAKNSVFEWKVPAKKTQEGYSVIKKNSQAHSETETYKKILENQTDEFKSKVINCKFIHNNETFLAADGSIWPCCYLWDEYIGKKEPFTSLVHEIAPEENWNNIYQKSFHDILNHPFYKKLQQFWDVESHFFQKRCFLSCGANGKLRNSFSKN